MSGYAAVVLAGGAGRRLGGAAKPLLAVGGRPMLDRVLAAVTDAAALVVVGPPGLPVPPGVLRVSEEPAGGGPVAALAAGLAALAAPAVPPGVVVPPEVVAVLAADLPFLTPEAVATLRATLEVGTALDGAVFIDADGRRQTLCGVWRTGALSRRLAETREHHGTALRTLLAGLVVAEVTAAGQPPAWYDCDDPEDLDRARRWG